LLKVKNKDRLLLTPHIGWASVEARNRLVKMVAKNIEETTF
ncbi:MAG: hydroxyacid dehydrogenase, partial [Erysipelotrichia bacterium]|nr:hydroxyacid dehydrogenase [Erysipelotrichia bacterium]